MDLDFLRMDGLFKTENRMIHTAVWKCMYRIALYRGIMRKFVDIAWYLYRKFNRANPIPVESRILYGVCCLSIIAKFWDDDEYPIVDDYCQAVGITTRRGTKVAAKWYWDTEWELLLFTKFQLTKISLKALKAKRRPMSV